jgi:hypothetical protein
MTGCAVCVQLRLEASDELNYELAPAAGGGWHEWAAALVRLLRRVGGEPARALIITQDPVTQRYVQMQIGHGVARVEASSNAYLLGRSCLSDDEEELLNRIGWRAPVSEVDQPDEYPSNWTLPRVCGCWDDLTEVILATIVGVFGFIDSVPVKVQAFQLERACRDCFFPVEDVA